MGWTSKHDWASTADAIKDEARPSAAYDIAWKSGAHYIYVSKETGKPYPCTFLTRRDYYGIWVKDIGEIRGKAMATKYLALANQYRETHKEEDRWLDEVMDCARKELAHFQSLERLKGLKAGDRVYIKDYYTINGWGTIHGWKRGNRSLLVCFPNHVRLVCCSKDAVDLEKTFA